MLYIKRAFQWIFTAFFINFLLFSRFFTLIFPLKVCIFVILFGFFIYYNINPGGYKESSKKMKIMICGYELLLCAAFCFIFQIFMYSYIIFFSERHVKAWILIVNAIISSLFLIIVLLNGYLRIFAVSKQMGTALRIAMIFLWWMPVVNVILLIISCLTIKSEYVFECKKQLRNSARKGKNICKTKYPVLFVHGVFFRDWKIFNYWGRIPKELTDNGATVYYGNHQSSASVEQCAAEIKKCILGIVAETGCERVNIIAHSKGGLDSRYAISCLGMDEHAASLTTINTPHFGCNFTEKIIEKSPEKLISSVDKKYNFIFGKLGDDSPDFFGGISELTAKRCAELNEKMPDCENVLYQSSGSMMKTRFSSYFPLNVGYSIIKPLDGDNDGLVATSSMKWGNFSGLLTPSKNKGISHGDMIDLTRKNIGDFDVCEFYVSLVNGLKEKGL